MSKIISRIALAFAAACALAALPALGQSRPAAPAPIRRAPVTAPAPAVVAKTPAGPHANITVHGRWTIVVRNRDGSVAARREFENALQLDGIDILPALLGGFATPGSWTLVLASGEAGTTGPCGATIYQQNVYGPAGAFQYFYNACMIVSSNGYYNNQPGCGAFSGIYGCNANLAASLVQTGTVTDPNGKRLPVDGLQLTGTAAVTTPPGTTGVLDTVGTLLQVCGANAPSSAPGFPPTTLTATAAVTPTACGTTNTGYLTNSFQAPQWGITATSLTTAGLKPITVAPFQTIVVTVIISFN